MAQHPVSRDPGTHFVVVPHTHWDREWYRPFEDFRRRLVALVDKLLHVLETRPDFRVFHFDGQTIVLDDYVAIRPHQADRLREHLASGRVQIGPWRVLPDEFLVTGESLIRNLQQGFADCARWGVDPQPVGYTPDQFGHVGIMPQILAQFGLRAGMVWRGVAPNVNATQFHWEAPDGTRLFTVYLAGSYSNGATLPERAEPLLDRLEEIRREQADFCRIPSLLVMNGSDHLEPQGRLPEVLAEVMQRRPGWSFEIGGLATFVEQAEAAAEHLPIHRGEFRHPWRANILPGVTSVRSYQKQNDFIVCREFEKYVEPLCTWAEALGDARGHHDFIDYAWRIIIENHPHDSICGCSVDAVHDEMDTRWAKVEQVGEQLRREALQFVTSRCGTTAFSDTDDHVLVTYAVARPAMQLVDVELHLDDPRGVRSLRDAAGVHHAVQVVPGDTELYFETTEPVETLRLMVAGIEGREVLGYIMNNLLIGREGDRAELVLICGHQAYGDVDIIAKRDEILDFLSDPSIKQVHVVGRSATKTRIQAVVPVSGQTALDAFGMTGATPAPTDRPLRVADNRIETAEFIVEIDKAAAVHVTDKRSNVRWERCLRLVDEGDRGDTYNFDPVPGGLVVNRPAEPPVCAVLADGPVSATIAVDATFALPAELTAERDARTSELVDVPVRLEVTCYRDLPRIDFRVTIDNAAKDHRLRAEIALPFAPSETIAEGPFGVVRRAVALPDNSSTVERFYGTAPMKSFVCVEVDGQGIGLFSRGIQEYEATARDGRGTLALTLLRCVGWLSRDDLEMRNRNSAGPKLETPGAQSLGVQTFEFAVMPYAGEYAKAGIPAEAHAYAYPPIGARTGAHAGPVEPGTRLVSASDAALVVSAVTCSRDRRDSIVRVYNESEREVRTDVSFAGAVESVTAVDLRERPQDTGDATRGPAAVGVRLPPSRIRTWRVRHSAPIA